MKRLVMMGCFVMLLAGCNTSGMTTMFGGVDESLLAQVPSSDMGGVYSAMDALEVAREEQKLAAMGQERAKLVRKLADRRYDLAKNQLKQRDIEADIAKVEALMNGNIGQPVDNQNNLASYRQKKLDNESRRYEIEAEVKKAELMLKDYEARIEEQKAAVQRLKNFKAADTVPSAAAAASETPTEDWTEPAKPSKPADTTVQSEPEEELSMPDYLRVEEDPDAASVKPDHPDIKESGLEE